MSESASNPPAETATPQVSRAVDLFAFAEVHADPMAFAVRGDVFRGYYVVSRMVNYLTKDGSWTHGTTAPDDGNWWDTQGAAARALAEFREANDQAETRPSASNEPRTSDLLMNPPDETTGSKASISSDLFDVGDRVAMSWGSAGATVFLVLSRTKDRLLVRSSNGVLLIMDDKEIENRSAVRMPPKKPPFWRRLFASNACEQAPAS